MVLPKREYQHSFDVLNSDGLTIWLFDSGGLAYCDIRNVLVPVDLATAYCVTSLIENIGKAIAQDECPFKLGPAEFDLAWDNGLSLLDDQTEISPAPFRQGSTPTRWTPPRGHQEIYLGFIDTTLKLHVPDGLVSRLSDDLVRLVVMDRSPDLELFITSEESSFALGDGSSCIHSSLNYRQLLAALHSMLFRAQNEVQDYFFSFHGAAVQYRHVNWLMPARSGAGKSTLVESLVDRGAHNFGDDVLMLDAGFNPITTGMPVCLKEGSPAFNDVGGLLMERLDGREFRYRWQDDEMRPQNNVDTIIVSPSFGKPPELKELSVHEKLERFLDLGYQVSIEGKVAAERLIDFLARTPGYDLSYSNSEQAIASIDDLASKTN